MNKKTFFAVTTVAAVAATLFVTIPVFADFKPSDWQFKKAVRVPDISETQYVQVTVDKEVYAKSSNLGDLRVTDGSGEEVPYQLVVKNSSGRDQYYSSRLLDLSTSAGQTSFTLDLGRSGNLHDRVYVQTPSENFRKQVSVYASDSNSNWRLLTAKGYIYDFTDRRANFKAGSGELRYPQSTGRFVHVVIGGGEGGLVSVSGAQVYRYDERQAREEGLTASLNIIQNSIEKSTELTADLRAPIPTHSITLNASESNFNRRVVIQASDDGSSWRLVGQGYIFKIATALFIGSQFKIEYPETRVRFIRAVVFNEDNRPIDFDSSAVFQSVVRVVIFRAEPDANYTFYYGNPRASSPRYDLARIFQYIESENVQQISLTREETNPSYVPPAPPVVPFTEKYPYLLDTALVILMIIIGVFLFIYIRKVASADK